MDFEQWKSCDDWMPAMALPLTPEQFHQLPRNASYKYEYVEGKASLTPRPQFFHAVLDLPLVETVAGETFGQPGEVGRPAPNLAGPAPSLRPFRAEDWPLLEPLFRAAFRRWQPFASLEDATLAQAARQSLAKTRGGGDGPFLAAASFVALDGEDHLLGAILLTLLPEGDPCAWASYYWKDPPPADAVERRQGRPHVTWVFVTPGQQGAGVGSALLAASCQALGDMGFARLFSTFLLGNEASLLWHWRNGFRLLPNPGARRNLRFANTPPQGMGLGKKVEENA